MLERLKPCPFCGKSAVAFCIENSPVLEKLGVKEKVWVVGCRSSDCIMYANKEKKTAQLFFWDGNISKLITKWNRRTAEADAEIMYKRMIQALLNGNYGGIQDGQ